MRNSARVRDNLHRDNKGHTMKMNNVRQALHHEPNCSDGVSRSHSCLFQLCSLSTSLGISCATEIHATTCVTILLKLVLLRHSYHFLLVLQISICSREKSQVTANCNHPLMYTSDGGPSPKGTNGRDCARAASSTLF